MHELSIAQSLLDIVLQEASFHKVQKIVKVGIKLGDFSAVEPSALSFNFDLIKKKTLVKDAELVIEKVALAGLCQDCGKILENMNNLLVDCSYCGSEKIEIIRGRELTVSYIETD